MRMFCRKNIVLDLVAALAISMSFMAVSAEHENSKLMSVDLSCTTPEDFFSKDSHSKLSNDLMPNDVVTNQKVTRLDCEYLDAVQRFSCIVNGRLDHSLETVGVSFAPKK